MKFTIAIAQADFDHVLSASRGFFSLYFQNMFEDQPDRQSGTEFWDEKADWPEPFDSSHLEGALSPEIGAHNLWGEMRLAKLEETSLATVIDFPMQSLDWQLIHYLCFALRCEVWTFRYDDHGSPKEPTYSEFMQYSEQGLVREVRVTWTDVLNPRDGQKRFRQKFEQSGSSTAAENVHSYTARKVVDRLPRSDLVQLAEKIAPGSGELIMGKPPASAVLLSGRTGGVKIQSSAQDLRHAKDAVKRYRKTLPNSPWLRWIS